MAWLMPGLRKNALIVRSSVRLSVENIIATVFEYYEVPLEMVKLKIKKRDVVKCRQISSWILMYNTKLTQKQIGLLFGGQDHSTVIYARNTIDGILSVERKMSKQPLTKEINELKDLLGIVYSE